MSDIDPATSAHHQVDLLRIEHAVREILDAIGEDPSREGCSKRRHGGSSRMRKHSRAT